MFWSMSRARKERASYCGAEGARVRLEVLFNTNIRWMIHYVVSLEIAKSWTANHEVWIINFRHKSGIIAFLSLV